MTKLEIHRRIAHLSVPSLQKINCPDCMITKGGTQGYNAERVEEQKIPIPLKRLNTDFYGPIRPMSIRGMKMILVFICDAIAHVWCIPIRHRDEQTQIAYDLITSVRSTDAKDSVEKVIEQVRSDNDRVFRFGKWQPTLRKLSVAPLFSVPYSPSLNGVVERFMLTLGSGLRQKLVGVDLRLWCYQQEDHEYCWNRVGRNYPR